jgi:cell division protein YceG involved in septum cleavage
MRRGWIALGAFLGTVAAGAAFATFAWRALHAELPIPTDGAWLEVASGTPLRRVTADLAQRRLLEHPALLDIYARLRGDATRIRAGEYQLARGITPLSLVEKLVSGQVFQHQLTRARRDSRRKARRGRDHGGARRARRASGGAVLPRHLLLPTRHD